MNITDLFLLEFKKNRCRRNWIILAALLLVQTLYLLWGMYGADHLHHGWIRQLYNLPLLNSILFPSIMAILASRHMDMEHRGYTWKLLDTLQGSQSIFLGKILYGFISILLLCILQLIIIIFAGYYFSYDGNPNFLAYGVYFINTLFTSFVLYLLQSLLSLTFHNQAVSISIGLCGSMAGLFLLFLPKSILYELLPWGLFGATMFVGMDWNPVTRDMSFYYDKPLSGSYLYLFLWIVVLIFIGNLICRYKDADGVITPNHNHALKTCERSTTPKSAKIKPLCFTHLPTEFIKIKRSPIWIAFLALPAISAFIGTFNYIENIGILKDLWYSLWSQHTLFLCYFFMPPLLGVFCSYIWRLEHTGTNWNQLMVNTSPWKIIKNKLFTSLLLLLFFIIWVFILYFFCGKSAGITTPLPVELFSWLIFGFIGGSTVVAAQIFLSLVLHNFVVPIGIALAGSIAGLILSSRGFWYILPYSLLSMGMRANNPYYEIDQFQFLAVCVFFIFLYSFGSVIYLIKSDVVTQA